MPSDPARPAAGSRWEAVGERNYRTYDEASTGYTVIHPFGSEPAYMLTAVRDRKRAAEKEVLFWERLEAAFIALARDGQWEEEPK